MAYFPTAELAYAEQGARQTLANTDEVAIDGLTVTVTIPVGMRYCIEFYCPEVSEDSGATAGDLVSIAIEDEATGVYATGHVYQTAGGVGSALFLRSGTQTSNGAPITRLAKVTNLTNPSNGAILDASSNDPMYIRIVRL